MINNELIELLADYVVKDGQNGKIIYLVKV